MGDPETGRPFSFSRRGFGGISSISTHPTPLSRKPPNVRSLANLAPFALALFPASAVEREIYFTDFEDAPVGDTEWIGYDGWVGDDLGQTGSQDDTWQAIELEPVVGQGQGATIGFNRPPGFGTELVTVARLVPHDPVATGETIVRFSAVVGVNDSDNEPFPGVEPPRDIFKISFFNDTSKATLATAIFNNTDAAAGIWRGDGDTASPDIDTGEEFITGEAQILLVEIDFANNTWSLFLGGFPVFSDVEFTARTDVDMNFGGIAITWERGSGGLSNWGNNWMLFDDVSVAVDTIKLVIPEDPFRIQAVTRDTSDCAVITWNAQPGFDYKVEYSENLVDWMTDLPGSTISEPTEKSTSYTDLNSDSKALRHYRVRRTPQS